MKKKCYWFIYLLIFRFIYLNQGKSSFIYIECHILFVSRWGGSAVNGSVEWATICCCKTFSRLVNIHCEYLRCMDRGGFIGIALQFHTLEWIASHQMQVPSIGSLCEKPNLDISDSMSLHNEHLQFFILTIVFMMWGYFESKLSK